VTSEEIKALRTKMGMGRKKFSDIIGVTRATVCSWEVGTRVPNEVNEQKLIKLMEENK
jgi:DNA-binding transcriptional regulator YiaG